MRKLLVLFFFLFFNVLMTEMKELNAEAIQMSFNDLSVANQDMLGKKVIIRGFWYPISSEEGVLASHTNLKSCCVGKPTAMASQILVKGDVSNFPEGRALTLEGVLNMNSRSTLLFVLKEPRVLEGGLDMMLFIIAPLIAFLIYALKKVAVPAWRRYRSNSPT